MGYTHYFPGLTATTEVIADAKLIIDASSVTICGPATRGTPRPHLSADRMGERLVLTSVRGPLVGVEGDSGGMDNLPIPVRT